MFYEDLEAEEIPKYIHDEYKKFESYFGTLVIVGGTEVKRLVGLLRDDSFDGEWCYRLLTFPNENDFKHNGQCTDLSIVCAHVVPLKGVIDNDDYDRMEYLWQINLDRNPYLKDYKIYEKNIVTDHPWSIHLGGELTSENSIDEDFEVK